MKRILITGGDGLIGREIRQLLQRLYGNLAEVVSASRRSGIHLLSGRSTAHLAQQHWDIVIHCAATPYAPGEHSDFQILSQDIGLTMRTLRIASPRKGQPPPHFVMLSSITAYGELPPNSGGRRLDEVATEQLPAPTDSIGMAKLVSERAVQSWNKECGGTFTIWRLNNVVSMHEPHCQRSHAIPNLYRQLIVERVPVLDLGPSGGTQRAFTHVHDVSAAVVIYLQNEKTYNQIFNLGSDEPYTIAAVAARMLELARLAKVVPDDYKPEIRYESNHTPDRFRVPAITKAARVLEWNSIRDLDQCLLDYIGHGEARDHAERDRLNATGAANRPTQPSLRSMP